MLKGKKQIRKGDQLKEETYVILSLINFGDTKTLNHNCAIFPFGAHLFSPPRECSVMSLSSPKEEACPSGALGGAPWDCSLEVDRSEIE